MQRVWAKLGFAASVLIAAVLASTSAIAQGVIQQSGPVTTFHAPAWFGNGIIADAGSPTAPYVSAFGLFNGSQCPFGVSSQTGPGAWLSPYSEFSICQTDTTTTLNFLGMNGQGAPNVLFNIGGVIYPFPGPSIAAPLMLASTNITAPALVHVSSSFTIAPANAATGLSADGFVVTNISGGQYGYVYFTGLVSGFSGLTGGPVYSSASTPGNVTNTPPANGSGYYAQRVGVAISSGSVMFNPGLMNGPL